MSNCDDDDDDDGDNEDDDELFLWYGWPTKGTIARDSHHRESLTLCEQGLNLLKFSCSDLDLTFQI